MIVLDGHAGSSVVGGFVGGWFVLRADRRQWQRDHQAVRTDRSHEAALAIADSVALLDEAVANWVGQPFEIDALRAAFNLY